MPKLNFLKRLVIVRHEAILSKILSEIASLKKLAMTNKMTLTF